MDFSTDAFIQEQVRELFKNATVLTIAHRINTIIHSDKIMILDKGELIEFDTPQVLIQVDKIAKVPGLICRSRKSWNFKIIIQDKNSLFRSLVEASEDSNELLRMLNVDDANDDKPNSQIKKRTAF